MREDEKQFLLGLANDLRGRLKCPSLQKSKKKQRKNIKTLLQDFYSLDCQLRNDLIEVNAYPTVEAFSEALNTDLTKAGELVLKTINLLQNEKVQYKVLFLPYIPSTWDALEGIYASFAQDERFITNIVIMPAHRYNASGRVSLYQDFLTEKNIPHTSYTKYDIEQDKPDIVFSNFPFDLLLEEPFYAEHIRQHCKMLVYVPYFGALSGFANYYQEKIYNLPMHLLADRIIVQSELMVKAYERHCPGPKGRYLPLGVPKIDSYKKNAEEALRKPKADWLEKINKRKVFLLDTHYNIHSLNRKLPGNRICNLTLLILKPILDYFSKHNELFLIWRPHPLQETLLANDNEPSNIYELKKKYDNTIHILDIAKNCSPSEKERLLINVFPEMPYSDVNGKLQQLVQNAENLQMFFIQEEYRQVMDAAPMMSNCIIDREPDSSMSAALSSAFITLGGGSLMNLYPSLNKPIIFYHCEPPLPKGEEHLIPHNKITYHPLLGTLVHLLSLRIFFKGSELPLSYHEQEMELLAKLSEHAQQIYWRLVEKNKQREVFTPEFLANINAKELDRQQEYYWPYAYDYLIAQKGNYFREEVLADIYEFECQLYVKKNINEIINYIEMIAAGQDPLRASHYEHYKQAITNTEQNCGQLVYEAIVRDFQAITGIKL